jgi:hypothetical protein
MLSNSQSLLSRIDDEGKGSRIDMIRPNILCALLAKSRARHGGNEIFQSYRTGDSTMV